MGYGPTPAPTPPKLVKILSIPFMGYEEMIIAEEQYENETFNSLYGILGRVIFLQRNWLNHITFNSLYGIQYDK